MNVLLDTHIALWAVAKPQNLSPSAKSVICAVDNTLWVSVASLWEIAIKHALGRGGMPVSADQALSAFKRAGFRLLSIDAEHALAVDTLPPLHQDPFDRILVAQASVELLVLMSRDPIVLQYPVRTLPA